MGSCFLAVDPPAKSPPGAGAWAAWGRLSARGLTWPENQPCSLHSTPPSASLCDDSVPSLCMDVRLLGEKRVLDDMLPGLNH